MTESLDRSLARALDAQDTLDRLGGQPALDRAISRWHSVVAHEDLASRGPQTVATVLGATANAVFERYRLQGAEADLENAIALYRGVRSTARAYGGPDGGDLGNLANALIARYEARGERARLGRCPFALR